MPAVGDTILRRELSRCPRKCFEYAASSRRSLCRRSTGCTAGFILTIGHAILNESGDVVEYVGTGMDVTEQRQAQAALETAFEEIKRLKDRLQDENLALREEIDQ